MPSRAIERERRTGGRGGVQQLGDDRKTVLKFAVNAKQISTPLLGWANRLGRGVENRGGAGRWKTVAVGKWERHGRHESTSTVKGNCVFN